LFILILFQGLQGVLQLVFSNVEDEYGSSFVSENANFIHTITIPDTMNYLPQHLVLVLPRKSNANGKGFVQKFILECSEMIKPWGQLTIRRQKRPKLWSTHEIRDMYKSGFINTVIQFVNKTQTYRVFITTEDLERTIIDLDAFDKESLMSIIKEIGDITVIKDLSLNYTHGVQNQTTTKTKFNFVKAKDEIKIAGLLDFSSSESIEKVSFNLTGYTENGQLNEHVTIIIGKQNETDYFYRLWSLLKTNDFLHRLPINNNTQTEKEEITKLNLKQKFLTPLTAIQTENGLVFPYENLFSPLNTSCVRNILPTERKRECELSLISPQDLRLSVQESTPWLSFSIEDKTILEIFTTLTDPNKTLNDRHVKRAERTNFFSAKIKGACCWVLFTERHYQGRRETICGPEGKLTLTRINSIQKV